MKKILFTVTAVVASLFASCDKNDELMNPSQPGIPNGSAAVTITLAEAPENATRAFFDTTAAAETWEKSLVTFGIRFR